MLKNLLKFIGIAFLIVFLGTGILYGIQYLRYRNSPEYQVEAGLKRLEKMYAEDPYGGETPEETLRLFVEALRQGDTDLAAKYFVLDKQEEWREDLAKMKEKELLDEMIKDLEKTYLSLDQDTAFFTFQNEDGFESQLVMHRNPENGRWKITEL